MAIQWADDFTRYGTGGSSRGFMRDGLPYITIGSTGSGGEVKNDPDPNESGLAFQLGYNSNNWTTDFRLALPTVVTAGIGVLGRFWLSSLPANSGERPALIQLQDGAGNIELYVSVQLNGSITVLGRQSGSLTTLADTVNPVVAPNSWNHYELIHNDSTGAGELRLNGVVILEWTGVDTGNQIEIVNFAGRSASGIAPAVYLKDLVIWDSTGTQNNSALGTVVVRTLKPDGDQTLGGWTTSTGTTGWDLIGEQTADDSDFIQADDTPPAASEFTLENLPPDITSVKAVLPVIRVRKTDGGDANIQTAVTADGTNYDNGADRPVTTAFTYYFDVSEIDPADSSPWTPVDVDAMRLRVDRTI